MNKRRNYNNSYHASFISKFLNHKFGSLITLMGIALIFNGVRGNIDSWQSPTVNSNETGMSIFQLYSKEPNIRHCDEGMLSDLEKQKVLSRLNYIRGLHGLPLVTYNYKDDNYTAKLALAIAVNADKNEQPNSSFRCWSEQAGIEKDNSLSYSIIYHSIYPQTLPVANLYKSEDFVNALLMDSRRGNSVGSRWLFNPFLKSISFGRVDGEPLVAQTTTIGYNGETVEREANYISGATINFISDENQELTGLNVESTAYPIGEYPSELFKKDKYQHGYPPMLFYIIAHNKKVLRQQDVDFSNSFVQIKDENGETLEVNSFQQKSNNKDLPNIITWKVDQIKQGMKYTITIKNVKVFDVIADYEYWFKLR